MDHLARLAPLFLLLGSSAEAGTPIDPGVEIPASPTTRVALDQSFIERETGFVMLGDGIAASLETGRMRWIITGREASAFASVVTIEPVGARPDVAPEGEQRLPGIVSSFRGAPSEWEAGQATFRSVRYPELWDGVDLVLEAEGQTLKGTYIVAAGGDPLAIRLRHRGADLVLIDEEGQLIVETSAGSLVDAAPVAWQEFDGQRREVTVDFALEAGPDTDVDVVFELGEYDSSSPLLIDPAVIVQAGFLGGAGDDRPVAVAVDDAGYVYVCGYTKSSESTFPATVGPGLVWQGGSAGDAYVAKLDPTGTTLIYAGFIGGTQSDYGRCLAVDSLGRAYVGGHTLSTENQGFPVTVGPELSAWGSIDGWVARVSADGSTLEFCGFVGGNSEDRVFGIDVDDSFRTYLVGRFESLSHTLPLTVGPELLAPGGATDGFVARLTSSGTSFEYCGYLGGDQIEDVTLVRADPAGGAWFAGWSMSANFPVVGSLGYPFTNGLDLVIGRVSPTGASLSASGYIGSQLSDFPSSLAVDDTGAAYIGGLTTDAATFPTLVGPVLVPTAVTEGVLMKVAPEGAGIEWAGFTGTSFNGQIVLDDDQDPWVLTAVGDGSPTGSDAAIGRLDPSGLDLEIVSVIPLPGDAAIPFFDVVPGALTPGATEFWMAGTTTEDETIFPVGTGPDVTANGMIDTILLHLQIADDPWTDLGFALAGTNNDPLLEGSGSLLPLSAVNLTLSSALENTATWLLVGFSSANVPFFGGTLVPNPAPPGLILPMLTDGTGAADLPIVWPAGLPSGVDIYWQHWVLDAGGPFGYSSSNGLESTTP